jgi:hypothetical protein
MSMKSVRGATRSTRSIYEKHLTRKRKVHQEVNKTFKSLCGRVLVCVCVCERERERERASERYTKKKIIKVEYIVHKIQRKNGFCIYKHTFKEKLF